MTTTEEKAREVLCSTGRPGGYVRELTLEEQQALADIQATPRDQWREQLDAFWQSHRERLDDAKATIEHEPAESDSTDTTTEATE